MSVKFITKVLAAQELEESNRLRREVHDLRRRLARSLWATHAMARTGNTRAFYESLLVKERAELMARRRKGAAT